MHLARGACRIQELTALTIIMKTAWALTAAAALLSRAPIHALSLSDLDEDLLEAEDSRAALFTQFLVELPALLEAHPFTNVNATGVCPFSPSSCPPCPEIGDIQDKIKEGANAAFDKLAATLATNASRVGGAQCHFQITEFSKGSWPCTGHWTLTLAEVRRPNFVVTRESCAKVEGASFVPR